jgi:DNA-binding response OmpR family regulator
MATYKVFIIEDDDAIREALRFVLTDAGYEVFEAPDGVVGLDLLRLATEPAVVILDLMMPRMSGLQLLQTCDQDDTLARQHHAFIVVTAGRGVAVTDFAHYLHDGHIAVVKKPFDVEVLRAQVEEAERHLDTE